MAGVSQINSSLEVAEQKWFECFKHDVISLAQTESFAKTFSPELVRQKYEEVMSSFAQSECEKDSLKKELREWITDETV